MFLVVFLSGVTMYFFTKEVTKNKKIALLAGIFYIFAPYRLTDMYIRNALAELTSFTFLPMVFWRTLWSIKRKAKREYILILGSTGLFLTHTVITMYVAILCFIYLLTQWRKLKKKQIRNKIIFSLIFIIILTSFFWLPILEHKLSTTYEVFKPGRMERTEVLIALKLEIFELFVTLKNSNMIFEIGIITLLILLLTPLALKKLKKNTKTQTFTISIYFL